MSWQKKVIWSEGMFLRPQHFQQQERYLESFANGRTIGVEGHFWGFRSLSLDRQALNIGKIVIDSAEGVLPDGTPFHFPAQGVAPLPFDVPALLRDERIMLALPLRRYGTEEVIFDDSKSSLARFAVSESETADTNSVGGDPAPLQVGDLRLQLVAESAMTDGWIGVGVVRVRERKTDHTLVLDELYIPPTLAAGNQQLLSSFTREIEGLLHQRGDALSARLAQPGRGGIGEVGDFLMLGLINRYEPAIRHFHQVATIHPERLFTLLLTLAGDLSTFTRDSRRAATYPEYDHDDLAGCYQPLMLDLRRSLSTVLEQNAIQIELQERNYGVRVAMTNDAELFRTASFVLAVHADVPAELVRSRFPTQVKIGPVERIRDLVNLHLPGVTLRALPIAPRQIPYNAGYNYFELDTANALWEQLDRSGGLAMHIAGEFPGLSLEFWAIRK
jgi:type VI secretion system protein ImpJ